MRLNQVFFFFNDTATTEIYTRSIVGSVRCVQETDAEYMGLFHQTINTSNSIKVDLPKPQISNGHFFVNLGNNHPLVRSTMKERWWWSQAADETSANIVWSQWRKIKFIKQLPKKKKKKKKKKTNQHSLIKNTPTPRKPKR
eukprot:TRINITY_DN69017_c0_g1_i2.p1 TRINITY_DN69017_c0_g1~~TRINITY_DN69017_c0_g1_i2.p1  ORF type:complete len:141 (-),score=43.70 TRINITY_DN69017_c0_g1_i2:86-508(-)